MFDVNALDPDRPPRACSVWLLFVLQTNLCQAIRVTQGKGLMPDNTSRFRSVKDGQQLLHYMGTSTFSEYTVLPEIAVAKISKAAPLDKVCLLGCGVSTGIGAVTNTCAVEEGATVAVFGLGGVGLSVIQGAVLSSASRIVAIDTNPAKWSMAQQMGATEFVNPNELPEGKTLQQHLIDITDGGVDYSFECTGNVKSMRAALEAAHKGWGTSCVRIQCTNASFIHALLSVRGRMRTKCSKNSLSIRWVFSVCSVCVVPDYWSGRRWPGDLHASIPARDGTKMGG